MEQRIHKFIPIGTIIIITVVLFWYGLEVIGGYYGLSSFELLQGGIRQERPLVSTIHLYNGGPEPSLSRVVVRAYYLQPQEDTDELIPEWEQQFKASFTKVSEFFNLQFGYRMDMRHTVYPKVMRLPHTLSYYQALIGKDYEQRAGEHTGVTLSLQTIASEVQALLAQEPDWLPTTTGTEGEYMINLFVINGTILYNGLYIPGLNDEAHNSMIMSAIFTDERFDIAKESILAHEIAHGMGLPDFYHLDDKDIQSYGLMGTGYLRQIEYSYIDADMKQKMID